MNIKRIITWATLPLLAVGTVFWLGQHKASSAAPLSYRSTSASRGNIVQTVTATGPLSAVATVEVGSQVSGIISKLYVDFNDAVTEGQLIAEIEPLTYEARVVQAEGDLASAKATLTLKQLNEKRSAKLFEQHLLSDSDYDSVKAELKQQEATVRNKEASLKSAQVDLDRCKIHAPISGTVISRDMDAGQTVQASFSAPKLFTLAQDLREMQITANVSEADIGGVEPGQEVRFTVDAFAGRNFTGKVRQVRNNPTTTNNVVNYYTIISVANEDLRLRPGMTANVVITTSHRDNVITVPNAALRVRLPEGAELEAPPALREDKMLAKDGEKHAQAKFVYVALAKPDAFGQVSGLLRPVPVRVGLSDSTRTEILSGLTEGDQVILGQAVAGAAATTKQATNPFAPKPPPGPANRR
jgi:HlyD family secretion protein